MEGGRIVCGVGICAAVMLALSLGAQAKQARCFTTDDGYYECDFSAQDDAGSFTISAPDYPTITLEVDRPGFAYGYINFGDRNVSLPGEYVRSRDDGACWNNPETSTKVCAW